MMTALSTAQPAYGLEGPSAGRTVDIATPQGSTYLRGNSVQSIGASSEFAAFLSDIVAHQPKGKEIHVIAYNLSAHKTQQVDAFLSSHSNVHMHFTPTYSSWLNQVELWFAKIERDVIVRSVFTFIPDLKRKLMRYIRQYNKQPKPVKWKYFDSTRRITPDSIVTVH
jgi:transposase